MTNPPSDPHSKNMKPSTMKLAETLRSELAMSTTVSFVELAKLLGVEVFFSDSEDGRTSVPSDGINRLRHTLSEMQDVLAEAIRERETLTAQIEESRTKPCGACVLNNVPDIDDLRETVARLTSEKAAVEVTRNIRTMELANAVANHLGLNPADEIPFEELTRRLWELPPVDGFGSHKADLAALRRLQSWREQAIQDIEALLRFGPAAQSPFGEYVNGGYVNRKVILRILRALTRTEGAL